jgi:hypothetical protein
MAVEDLVFSDELMDGSLTLRRASKLKTKSVFDKIWLRAIYLPNSFEMNEYLAGDAYRSHPAAEIQRIVNWVDVHKLNNRHSVEFKRRDYFTFSPSETSEFLLRQSDNGMFDFINGFMSSRIMLGKGTFEYKIFSPSIHRTKTNVVNGFMLSDWVSKLGFSSVVADLLTIDHLKTAFPIFSPNNVEHRSKFREVWTDGQFEDLWGRLDGASPEQEKCFWMVAASWGSDPYERKYRIASAIALIDGYSDVVPFDDVHKFLHAGVPNLDAVLNFAKVGVTFNEAERFVLSGVLDPRTIKKAAVADVDPSLTAALTH